MINRGLIRD